MFITKTNHTVDLEEIKGCIENILSVRPWPDGSIEELQIKNQIGLNHRPGAEYPWLDASGSLINPITGEVKGTEYEFTQWNERTPSPLITAIEQLASQEGFQIGRVRIMKLDPKTGLTVHYDQEQRYHLVIETNPYSYFGTTSNDNGYASVCYHVPADGHFYKVDTRLEHFVYNGGRQPRIHLVICALE